MAVYTEVPDDILAEFIASYGLGNLHSYKGIAEGVENTNYIVHTDKGPFILTLYEKRVAREDLPYFLELMEFLAKSGVSCPVPLRDKDNNQLRELEGRPAALISFLEGFWVRRPKTSHCAALGQALAQFHLAGLEFNMSRANSLSVEQWPALYDGFAQQAKEQWPALCANIESELDFLMQNWPQDLPKGVIHADLFPDNVFFLEQKLSGVIDFYFACNDVLSYDIAICLNAWCFENDHSFNMTKARALLKNYNRLRPLSSAEQDALPILARGAAMRFLLTRAYDWFHTPENAFVKPKDPMEYARRLAFHQNIKTVREYGFED